ncbi:MAG: sulfate ABC transporter ATP-binding protein [Clostridiales bacterium GWF2_36_10]|nr:MAG: sulfate ABC transporter ATP-binding protein [Clostridiales bacterium GWF2_36_10]HAN20506.1 sulfate ABC transporter ATP-binding protein [Clostridiales bacterium]
MLQIKNIFKSYKTGNFSQIALNGINVEFRKSEFVAILGHSGSGKTTCLNIIGGLDRYDSGDIIINGKSTKSFKDADWDAYRNNSIGFIFQNYNLITHLNIIDNVELGLTLSGVPAEKRHAKAKELLDRVGLTEHIHKKPGQLSGGQMQRVAIARALANDPDIILADEPTGALDSTTSVQIMELIKEIAKDKLVIMVTHNAEIAKQYADRVIHFTDGKIDSDSNPPINENKENEYKLKKTAMSFLTALKLSGRNISTKKWRTILTAFASSIGIIGIALILSLSSGFQEKVDEFEADALSEFPIMISNQTMNGNEEQIDDRQQDTLNILTGNKEYADTDEVILFNSKDRSFIHTNILSDDFLEYIKKINPEICNSIGYTYFTGMNLLREVGGDVIPVSISTGFTSSQGGGSMNSMDAAGLASYPTVIREGEPSYLESNYDVLEGAYPKNETEIVLVVNNKNEIDRAILENLGFKVDVDKIKFTDIIGTQIKLITNNDFYIKTNAGSYVPSQNHESMYNSENNIVLKISAVVRLKADVKVGLLGNGIAYSDSLVQRILGTAIESDIVKDQINSDYSVFTLAKFETPEEKEFMLTSIGGNSAPFIMYLYPTAFEDKEAILDYIDEYNKGKAEKDVIIYTDLASSISEMTSGILDGITLVLIAFAAISLVVSLIMIGIITYISVLERTREIGVLRALGARKKDITRVFNAETFIIGTISGLLGIGIAYLLTLPINVLLEHLTGLKGVATLNPLYALGLITISVALTLLGGTIPARMAAKKDPVEALRSE